MNEDESRNRPPLPARLFTPDGKPLKVLSTSLGIALLANALASAGPSNAASAETSAPSPSASASSSAAAAPVLSEWSTDAVKAYFDPSIDWNLPMPDDDAEKAGDQPSETASAGGGTGGGGGTTIVHASSGFGWDDLLLYHLIFNRGGTYSSTAYYGSHPAYDARSGQAYKPAAYDSDSFRNKAVVGSTVRPKTSNATGSITRRSTSSSPGGIGGKSSGFSSSGSSHSSSSSHSSGFGG